MKESIKRTNSSNNRNYRYKIISGALVMGIVMALALIVITPTSISGEGRVIIAFAFTAIALIASGAIVIGYIKKLTFRARPDE